ncbi:SDR family oxidoreductase [Streptomyces avicenniae]|uniref:SDR family oxidoreductase n=1 Tax=Streptomyces avicenniae TaxID=500153 RepID=UPI0006996898|nr:SDR family oxidoreductase [Streptomyces avicenniae]
MKQGEQGQQHDTAPAGEGPLTGRVALVAGATRGAGRGMAVQLGAAGATVYVTGRTTRASVSEMGRASETIEETAELVTAAGGEGIAVPTDHLERDQVRALVERIDREQGRLDVLVNDIWGGDHLWWPAGALMWEADLDKGLRMLRLGVETHIVTSHYALPLLTRRPGGLLVEITDGTVESNAVYRGHFFYDLAKYAPIRMVLGLAQELGKSGCTAVTLTPGFLRSETMLDTHMEVTEDTWRDAVAKEPAFAVSESPAFVGRAVAALAADPDVARWNGRSLSSGGLSRVYGFTDIDGSRPDAEGYIRDVVNGDSTASPEDYR